MPRGGPPDDDDDDDDEFSDDDDDDDHLAAPPARGGGGGGRQAPSRNDDFDEFEDSMQESPMGGGKPNTQGIKNQPYDEAMELSSDGGESPAGGAAATSRRGGGAGSSNGGGGGGGGRSAARSDAKVDNQPYDEAVELSDDEDDDGSDDDEEGSPSGPRMVDANPRAAAAKAQMGSTQGGRQGNFGSMQAPRDEASDEEEEEEQRPPQRRAEAPNLQSLGNRPMGGGGGGGGIGGGGGGGGGGDDDDDYGGGNEDSQVPAEGMYNPAEFADLDVNDEIEELFQYITRYKPHNIELETRMRPFIPDYIPSVGSIDPFIKVPRPDGRDDGLGLAKLDEPASVQSDPTVLILQLRAVSKSSGNQPMLVRAVEHAERDPKAINGWISSIQDLHRHKPAPSVRYKKPMPDIEALMQIWPEEIEKLLESAPLPDADINLDLASYARVVLGMLDIPVYNSLTESLHVLFTLYSDFKANVHFQQQLANNEPGGGAGMGMGGGAETFELS